jgi:hypothetical protein
VSADLAWLEALRLPRRVAQASWGRRVAAAGVFIAAAAAIYWATHLPVAMPVEDAKGWQVASGDEITLIEPRTASLLTFQSPVGKGVTLRLAKASLSTDTANGLGALGVSTPAGPVAVQWITRNGGGGRAMIEFNLRPTGPHPALVVKMTGGDGIVGLAFSGRDARLAVSMSGALVDNSAPDAQVSVGGEDFTVTGGAFPFELDVPAGAPVSLSYAQTESARPVFRWGVRLDPEQHFSDLPLAAVRLRREGEADRLDACGAPPKAFVAWRSLDVTHLSCAQTLRLKSLDLSPDGAAVRVNGQGFVAENGRAHVLSWKEVSANPLISGLAGAGFASFVTWTIHTVLGKPKKAASAPAPKRRRRAAKSAA